MIKKETQKRWLELRNDIDEAIRAGLTAREFMELNDISRDQWYRMKPIGFKWHKIQTELNIKRKNPVKNETVKTKNETIKKTETEKVAIVLCKGSDLKTVLANLLD